MAQPVYNPPIPYLGPIPGGCQPGQMITIDGFIPNHAQRFAINIQCGPGVNPRDDIALHINVRFPEMCIVRNNLQSMNWGAEDVSGGMPLSPGKNFQAILLCEQQSFKLALNGQHFCEFQHRTPIYRVSHLTIDGDVTISMIQFQGSSPSYQPGSWNSPMGMASAPSMEAPPPYGPPPPYSNQPVYTQSTVPLSYSSMPHVGGFQPPAPIGGYQPPPPVGGYQPPPPIGGYQPPPPIGGFQPPFGGGYQPPYPTNAYQPNQQVPSFNRGNVANPPMPPAGSTQKKESSMGVKALKYGAPLAAVGLGAYALGGGFSRSSSSSDDDWLG
ncbi:uncharacterized protein LOC143914490 isoform X2 [Arctopsyche grandis]|uniref:uncharacterized protein LOC143914490 isoform X2 n=1 Tax=Arctopsyche grandis TaxID=121162 RepID=UPI00406D7962